MKVNELKVTDLMVGDWVNLNFDVDYKTGNLIYGHVQVASINKDGTIDVDCTFDNSKSMQDGWYLKLIEPIPLTPEILKKNGFVNSYIDLSLNKDSVYKYNHFYTGNSVIVDMESNKLIVKYENDIWMNLPYNRTIYVHELQHVLKHCDIKKEIII
jgi:hypothetical protein